MLAEDAFERNKGSGARKRESIKFRISCILCIKYIYITLEKEKIDSELFLTSNFVIAFIKAPPSPRGKSKDLIINNWA